MTDHFDEKAKDWDSNERVKRLSAAVGAAILEQIPLDDTMDVLDFGAGTGLISAQLVPQVRKVVALDTSAAMLAELAAKAPLRAKVETVCQDLVEKPLGRTFDLIVSAMALHHVPDTAALFGRFAEHLKPGGRVALADLDKEDGSFHPEGTQGVYHQGFEREALRSLLETHGFEAVAFTTAHTVEKDGKTYPVFLVNATRR